MFQESLLKETYEAIEKLARKYSIPLDSFEVVKEVEKYRQYWKPKGRIRVVLLAESHVRTQAVQFNHMLDRKKLSDLGLEGYPEHFVKFVYCLGSGENELLSAPMYPPKKNATKSQFWEILWCCTHNPDKETFSLTKRVTPDSRARLKRKVDLLRELEGEGIWLMDASIVGISKLKPMIKEEVIRISWTNYVEPLILSLNPRPECMVIIGKGVSSSILGRLKGETGQWEGIHYTVIHQPQSHLTVEGRRRNLKRVYTACSGMRRQ